MRRVAIAALALSAGVAHAALTCPKVDYAEARDWAPEEVQHEYCKAGAAMRASVASSRDMMNVGLQGEANRALQDAKQCQDLQAMLGRVIENVHRTALPHC